ncbi:MAG: YdcF family protein [Alphaproteobacteria bacterium]
MFVFSKIAVYLVDPGVWLLILLGLGTVLLWTRWRRGGRALLTLTFLLVLAVSTFPVGEAMLATLEERFPAPRAIAAPVDGIIVLGGAVRQRLTLARGQPALNEHAERMTEFVALARRFPTAKLAFTGGSASLFHPDIKETAVARLFFNQMGLDGTRVIYEGGSRNTYENAVFTRRLLRPRPGERWLLVTSATHMPRAIGAFRKAGWDPVAYPVDYQTRGLTEIGPFFNLRAGLNNFAAGLHEWLGLITYRLLGRSDTLFPKP